MKDFCYTAIEAVPAKWRFTRGTGASLGTPEARPLWKTLIPPVLSTVAKRGAFSAQPKITSHFQQRHKGLAVAFSCPWVIEFSFLKSVVDCCLSQFF